ncbi:DDE-type integrase/transposase/recombinase [Clostridium grantii]|uniref:Mu transposase, C-terminal n=1 Tax=Clostridium grantii DSM 8605 TaxID=1121316 RepID=A0A1M5Y322_9CLOT|nr:DDE-type integrase/transposase/recombinase [Clostridium grantii]SHI06480.1 Mu transposase, C-terminal [Clostridium grantii DSM 8605]
MNNKEMIEIASIRLALIAPAINNTFTEKSKIAYYRRVSTTPVKLPNGNSVLYSPGTLSNWESDYNRFGFDALLPKTRSDVGKTRKLTDVAIEHIFTLKNTFPKINATLIYHKLIEDGFINEKNVSLSTIQRFIKNNDLKSARCINMKDRKAFEEEFATGMYQGDTCYGPYITENGECRRTYLIMLIDDKSRLIVGGRFFYNDNSYNFQKVLKEAVARYGIPNKLYLDNGSPYKNEQLSLICGSLGIVELHTMVRDGASKGKVERNFRTLKSRWLNALDTESISSLAELNDELFTYINKHNITLHSSTKERPINRYKSDLAHVKIASDSEWLANCFMNRITRRVNNDATISIDKISYDVPMEFIKQKVEVRYLPDDMDNAYIYYQKVKYSIRKTNKVENGKTKRKNSLNINYSKDGVKYV